MLDTLIISTRKLSFVKLCRNRFLKNRFETTLRCTVKTVGEMHETILSITGGDLETLQLHMSIVRNFQPLTIVYKNSILDTAVSKLYFILICFCFKWFLMLCLYILGLPKKSFQIGIK